MKLIELLNRATRGYPDHYLRDSYDPETGAFVDAGEDTLAEFIVKEIQDVYNEQATDDEQIAEAVRALEIARIELIGVALALRQGLDDSLNVGPPANEPVDTPDITLVVQDGLVQDVIKRAGLEHLQVVLRDYDVCDESDDRIATDEEGKLYSRVVF